ncbi:hypothetical protein [Listeria booriae]|uniref:hypothetical protein n=1 Tax=Listeria booriae TaxID=1552123 RepID=UPI001626BBA1|nr:hypothetical protein [Listeria booriae]MBC1233660.1 hypothetical protein [Listeria booriae]
MTKIFRVETKNGTFDVKADNEELAKAHMFAEYEDYAESGFTNVNEFTLEEAEDINIEDEYCNKIGTLKEMFEESMQNPDILAIPGDLL